MRILSAFRNFIPLTKKIHPFPVVLVGRKYWEGLIAWLKQTVLEEEKYISPDDLDLFAVVDTADEAVNHIIKFYNKHLLKPNF